MPPEDIVVPPKSALTTPPPAPPGDKDGAGAGDPPPPGDKGTPPAQITLPDNWIDTLPDDLKGEASLKQFKDFPSLVKSLVHAQKAVGADKIPVPSKHATDADWKETYKKLGLLPESLEKYDVKTPDIFKGDAAVIDKLKAAAFEANVSPKQFQKLVDIYGENLKELMVNQQTMAKQEREQGIVGLKAELGKAYEPTIAKAYAAVKKFGDEGLNKLLDATGLGDHPAVIKAFAKMGEALGEDSLDGHGSGPVGTMLTPAAAKQKYASIMGDATHPYNKAEHPNHAAAVEEVKSLFEMAFPSA